MSAVTEVAPPQPAAAAAPAKKGGGRRLLVLLHGEKANDDAVREAILRVRAEGNDVIVRVTFEAGDVDRLVREAMALGTADTLVAAGGDGTVREVVAAVLKHTGGMKDTRRVEPPPAPEPGRVVTQAAGDPPVVLPVSVAVLPLGTSNDFAACTGIPTDLYEALSLATREDTLRPIDIGLLNGEVFLNTATIGASADLGLVTSSGIKRILGPLAFLVTGVRSIRRWQPVQAVLCFPEVKEHGAYVAQQQQPTPTGASLTNALSRELQAKEAHVVEAGGATSLGASRFGSAVGEPAGDAGTVPVSAKAAAVQAGGLGVGEVEGVPLLHATAANSRQVASMVAVSPMALLDDGMLDILYLTGNVAQHVRRVLFDWFWKGSRRTKVVKSLLRVPWLEVATESPMPYSVDGEPLPPTSKFRYSLLHRAVRFHLPDDRMLVAGQAVPEPQDAELAAQRKGKGKGASNPLRIPRGRLRPPSLADMVGRVVRFRKQRRWGPLFKGLAKTLFVASLGGLAVHFWHRAREQAHEAHGSKQSKASRAKDTAQGKKASSSRRRRGA